MADPAGASRPAGVAVLVALLTPVFLRLRRAPNSNGVTMTTRAGLVVTVRVLAAIAVLVFVMLAVDRSTSDVTFTFPASDTSGLTDDVVFECGSPPTGFDLSAGGMKVDGIEAYDAWALAKAKETAQVPDTTGVTRAACEAARDSRVISLIWLVAAALTSGLVLLGAILTPTRPR